MNFKKSACLGGLPLLLLQHAGCAPPLKLLVALFCAVCELHLALQLVHAGQARTVGFVRHQVGAVAVVKIRIQILAVGAARCQRMSG